MQRVGVQCSGSRFPSSVLRVSHLDGCSICICRQGLYHEAHSPLVTDTVHATKQRCRGSPRHYISRVLQSPLPCPKEVRKLETVIDLSFLNSFLEIPHFTMETAESIQRSLPRDAWVTSIDLVDAYFHIPIHRGYRRCLRFQTRDTIYQFRALPFGLSPAPWVFTKIMTEIKMLVHLMDINLCQYLDDWLIY